MSRPHLAALLRELGFQPDDLRALADELEGAPADGPAARRVLGSLGKTPFNSTWPRTGGVYVARAGNRVKIGRAGNIWRRLSQMQGHCPYRLQLLAVLPGGADEETALHQAFADEHLHGEWFSLSARMQDWLRGGSVPPGGEDFVDDYNSSLRLPEGGWRP